MTTRELDEALAGTVPEPETAITVVAPTPRRHRHQYVPVWQDEAVIGHECRICLRPQDPVRSRRGRSARRRGNDYERDVAAALGGVKVGMYGGPVDVQTPLLNVQVKVRGAFPSWMTDELAKLPRTGGRVPTLVVADTPGSGRRRRALVVMSLDDFRELHGGPA